MDLQAMPIFRALGAKADYLDREQKVLASNVANADTPDYRAKRLAPFEFEKVVQDPEMRVVTTSPDHQQGTEPPEPAFDVNRPDKGGQSLNGNNVTLEEEMRQAAEVKVNHQLVTRAYKSHVRMMKSVLGGSGGGGGA